MFKKIVIPLDGSKLAEKVLPYVRQIAKPADTHLVLMRNIEINSYALMADTPLVAAGLYDAIYDDAATYLSQQKEELEGVGYSVELEMARGDTATGIVNVATDLNADLIAMTTHGRTGLGRIALGSVADRVIRHADQPILLVQASAGTPTSSSIHKILVPLDGSELSEQALPVAQTLATKEGCQILLLQSIEQLANLELAELLGQIVGEHGVLNEWYEQAVGYLRKIKDKLSYAGIPSDYHVAIGQPAECILHASIVESCDLIVMSTHGRSGINRWFYGSVAGKVLHNTERPLLLMRGQVREEVFEQAESPAMEMQPA